MMVQIVVFWLGHRVIMQAVTDVSEDNAASTFRVDV
jgi:hypothetical protein